MAKPVSFGVSPRIEWKIKHIFSVSEQESEEFKFQSTSWRLALEKVTVEGAERIRVLLKETEGEEVNKNFTSRVFIVDKNHMPQFLTEKLCEQTDEFYDECIWWMDIKDLWQRKDILSQNSVVSFVCILMTERTSEERKHKSLKTSINAKPGGGSVEAHLLDFRRLLDDSSLSDVTLKCGDRKFPAHTVILSARSQVFAAMLRNDMSESRTGVIEVSDVDAPILEQLLQFMYSCKLPDMSMDAATQLYEAADKYGVVSLMKDCTVFMRKNLTEENACSILFLADAHSDSDLKDYAVSFIVKTNLFQKDEVWLKFCEAHPKLANEVLNRICKSLSCIF